MLKRTHDLGLFNGNILVVDHGKQVYRKSIGFTDGSASLDLNGQYRFHIGSIAKEFNACAIMMLSEQGKLKLSDPVSKYLPGLPSWAEQVSILNLLQYSSGVPDLKWKAVTGDQAAMDSLLRIKMLDFRPGTAYAYNNSNTFLQRQIVAQVSGMSFSKFVTTKILIPLKMSSSIVDPDDQTGMMAKSFNDQGVTVPLLAPISGWTAVTMDDFYKWELALESFRLISPASTKVILTPFAPGKQCGLGGGEMVGDRLIRHVHDGTAMSYQALLLADVKPGRTIILLTNNKQNNLYDIGGAIVNILDGKAYEQPKKQVLTALQNQLDQASGKEMLDAFQALRSNHSGDYNFSESALNTVGYTLLAKKRVDEAILVFEYNTTLFPASGNVFDSLAEAYLAKGDKVNALMNYKRSFAIDPSNASAKEKIAELQRP